MYNEKMLLSVLYSSLSPVVFLFFSFSSLLSIILLYRILVACILSSYTTASYISSSRLPLFPLAIQLLSINMRSNFYLAISALATLAAADNPNAFNIPKGGYHFEVGEPTTLKWNPSTDGTVSLKLQSGEVSTPESGSTIACEYPPSISLRSWQLLTESSAHRQLGKLHLDSVR